MESLLLTGLQAAYVASLGGAWLRFQRACRDPQRAQARRLQRLLTQNRDTLYGKAHGFSSIGSVGQYQDRVPIATHDALAPWIERVASGEPRVLSAEPVVVFERTSGSTAANKLIPYTRGLLAEFSAATGAWLCDLHLANPGLFGTRSYWSLSPAARKRECTAGGIPIGFADDTEYFGPVSRWALRRMMAVSSAVLAQPSIDGWRRETCLQLLSAGDLGLISVWSPTFLTRIMEAIAERWAELREFLPWSRRVEIERGLDAAGQWTGERVWPRLRLVSCWRDGSAADFLPGLRRFFPTVPVQGKGLLATEGVLSFPLWGEPAAVLAVTSHFLEFLDLDQPARRPLLAHELVRGGSYSPLLTTGSGFCRYHLEDIVRCVGFHQRTPLVRFEGKLDRVSDLCGEKLNGHWVEEKVRGIFREQGLCPSFALLAPVLGQVPHYALFLEADLVPTVSAALATRLEAELEQNCHYAYCRKLGQLDPLTVTRVSHGFQTYEITLQALGIRAGDIKPALFDHRPIWAAAFASAGPLTGWHGRG